MNLSEHDARNVATAVAGIESWLDTVRGPEGYGGPVVGLRDVNVMYCGPGYDWRYEGLLDGYREMFRVTGDADYLDRIERDLKDIQAAQLLNGAFRNSYFDHNPMEGGMPHEPAMLAAVCRARRCLLDAGRKPPEGTETMVERYVTGHLLKQLWNKQLQTFNDWPASEFQYFSPASVAATIELLLEYGDGTHAWDRVERYVRGAAESLLRAQIRDGALAGGMPPSSRGGEGVSPFLAARCLPALAAVARKTGDARFAEAAQALAAFVRGQIGTPGDLPKMVFLDRPPVQGPIFLGAVAGVLLALSRAGLWTAEDLGRQLGFLLSHQTASGAFRTAVGFGRIAHRNGLPDWRDVLPVCGWQDKIFCLLAALHPGERQGFSSGPVEQPVRVPGGRGMYREDTETIRITDRRGHTLYSWEKTKTWASACLL